MVNNIWVLLHQMDVVLFLQSKELTGITDYPGSLLGQQDIVPSLLLGLSKLEVVIHHQDRQGNQESTPERRNGCNYLPQCSMWTYVSIANSEYGHEHKPNRLCKRITESSLSLVFLIGLILIVWHLV